MTRIESGTSTNVPLEQLVAERRFICERLQTGVSVIAEVVGRNGVV